MMGLFRRPDSVPSQRFRSHAPTRDQHHADSVARRQRVLNIVATIGALIVAMFAIAQLSQGIWRVGIVNAVSALIFATVPLLHRFGEVLAPLTVTCTAYVSFFIVCWNLGTGTGMQFYFLIAASIVVLMLGIEHVALAATLAGIGAALTIALEVLVPNDTGVLSAGAVTTSFVISTASAIFIAFATVWYALREIARAEVATELEYERSESLLANILPASVAQRLKGQRGVIADRYDDASILFADIAGFTKRASDTPPADLVRFLDRLYTQLDDLVDLHGLEKIKTSGDSYMVVSGVPQQRPDHVEALASFALDVATAVANFADPDGAVPLRIGIGMGPVVAGVVGTRRFFYDVWGDAVNVASRMESTSQEGRIQVPQAVYERLNRDYVLEERGDVEVKGKGTMHTWYLVARREQATQ
jgi:adenylate cyclase